MRSNIECIPCILNFCIRTLNFCDIDEVQKEKVFKKIVNHIGDYPLDKSPAAIADFATGIIKDEIGIEDIYRKEKREQNEKALGIYPRLKEMVRDSEDRLKTAFMVSATGNVIDLGAHADFDVESILHDFADIQFSKDDFEDFRSRLNDSKTLLFIADNCGEIIFDRVLLEELNSIRKIVAVKSKPFINDVTINDVIGTGIDKTAEIIETGTCNLDFDSDEIRGEFKKIFDEADIIISKGHANFEALHGKRADIYFLLRAKCDVVARVIGVRKGDFVFCRFH
ncbi:DUF89 family protein [candidate division WOR-3 bacterium]|nr:DUF89 family protein [candidate division WOR-3 bacterium]MCK4576752.1 DUF89 family protein [candidate division WOR-3 bacterium]